MERLIFSTASQLKTPAPLPRHRHHPFLLPRASALSAVASLPRHGFPHEAASLFSNQEGPPPPYLLQQPDVSISAKSSSLSSVPCCFGEEDARGARPGDEVAGGGQLRGSVYRKVRALSRICLSSSCLFLYPRLRRDNEWWY